MSSRQAFAPVVATVLIAITAALLHPVLDLGPLLDIEPQGTQRPAANTQGR